MLWDFAICPLKGNICLLIKWLEIALLIRKALLLTPNSSTTKSILLNNKHKFIYAISLFRFEFVIVLCTNCEWVLWPPGYPRWKSFREIPLSNAFHPLQTFQLGSCTKSVQINLIHHQCVQLPMKGRKVKMRVFPSNCPGGNSSWLSCQKLLHLNGLSQRLLMGAQRYLPNIFMSLLPTNFKHIIENFLKLGKSI